MLKQLIVVSAAVLMLPSCANQSPPPEAGPDYNEGIAKSCTATPIDLSNSASTTAKLTMTNDGWCAVRTVEKDGQPFLLGLMKVRPDHGHVVIQKAGNQTRIEYTADNRYVGADKFTVALRPRAAPPNTPDYNVQIEVQVAMGEGRAATATPAAPPSSPPATSPRRPTHR